VTRPTGSPVTNTLSARDVAAAETAALPCSSARDMSKRQLPGDAPGVPPSEKRNRTNASHLPLDVGKALEEARRRAQEVRSRPGGAGAAARPPPRAAPPPAKPAPTFTKSQTAEARPPEEVPKPSGIHPLLQSDPTRIAEYLRSHAPRVATVGANRRQLPGRPPPPPTSALDALVAAPPPPPKPKNPYLTAASASETAVGPKPKSMHRALHFHRPGHYIHEADQMRREEKLQELKERIEATARQAGVKDELLEDENVLRVRLPYILLTPAAGAPPCRVVGHGIFTE